MLTIESLARTLAQADDIDFDAAYPVRDIDYDMTEGSAVPTQAEYLVYARAALDALRVEVEVYKQGLRPLAAHMPHLLDMIEDERPVPWLTLITYGDVRRAHALLSEATDDQA